MASEETQNKYIEEYPYLASIAQTTIFLPKEDFEKIKNDQRINVLNESIPVEFLKRIISEEMYYNKTLEYFNDEIRCFSVGYIMNGDAIPLSTYSKAGLLQGIMQLIKTNTINVTEEQKERLKTLYDILSYDSFKSSKEKEYSTIIEGEKFTYQTDELISILELSEEEYNKLLECKTYKGNPVEYVVYAIKEYIKKGDVLNKYIVPELFAKRYQSIIKNEQIDIQYINILTRTEDEIYKTVRIDEDLRREILKDMPRDFSPLEKAIYIYYKMCKTLKYDEEYYAVNQKGEATIKHRSTDYITTINPQNNEVVCFEFNLIYSKFLSELGVKFRSDYKGAIDELYGEGHANLKFRYDKFLVSADSVTSILNGDLINAKINNPIVGLKCGNTCEQTRKEYNEAFQKVYALLREEDKSKSIDELLEDYSKETSNLSQIPLQEKLNIMLEKMKESKYTGMDKVSYLLRIRKIIFSEEQRGKNFDMIIVRNNKPTNDEKVASTNVIFVLNENGFKENEETNKYYILSDTEQIYEISKEELTQKFIDIEYELIEDKGLRIPGIRFYRGKV